MLIALMLIFACNLCYEVVLLVKIYSFGIFQLYWSFYVNFHYYFIVLIIQLIDPILQYFFRDPSITFSTV